MITRPFPSAASTRLLAAALAASAWALVGSPTVEGTEGQGSQGTNPPVTANGSSTTPDEKKADVPPDYVVGVDDVLEIDFWGNPEISGKSFIVRPDGKITLRGLGDIEVAGLTPEEVTATIVKAATVFFRAEPTVTVGVVQINSRQVTISGEIVKSGRYPISYGMTVMDLIGVAGGLTQYADKDDVTLMRKENGELKHYRINVDDVSKGKKMEQNMVLKPGDIVWVRGG